MTTHSWAKSNGWILPAPAETDAERYYDPRLALWLSNPIFTECEERHVSTVLDYGLRPEVDAPIIVQDATHPNTYNRMEALAQDIVQPEGIFGTWRSSRRPKSSHV